MDIEERNDRFLPPGTKVKRDVLWNGVEPRSEYGVVVHCWANAEIAGFHDCVIAFFGERPPPAGQPDERPYLLRYAAISLRVLDEWPSEG